MAALISSISHASISLPSVKLKMKGGGPEASRPGQKSLAFSSPGMRTQKVCFRSNLAPPPKLWR